jgi:hypothetical protein
MVSFSASVRENIKLVSDLDRQSGPADTMKMADGI